MEDFHPGYLLNAIVFAVLGIAIFSIAFVIIDKMTPYHLWKEIVEDKNVALAVLVLIPVGFGFAFSWISATIGLAVHDVESAQTAMTRGAWNPTRQSPSGQGLPSATTHPSS